MVVFNILPYFADREDVKYNQRLEVPRRMGIAEIVKVQEGYQRHVPIWLSEGGVCRKSIIINDVGDD